MQPEVSDQSSSPLALLQRAGWGIADQAPSSLTNFTLSVVVARADVPAGFGAMEASRLPPEPPTLVQPC